jgi:hypothetical protein
LPHECPIAIVANTSPAPLATTNQSLLQVLPNSPTPPSPHIVTQSMTGSSQPKLFPDFKLYRSLKSAKHPLKALSSVILPQVPITVAQAKSHPSWFAAMESEFQALHENDTWTLCPQPLNRNIIKNKWVFKLKQHSNGSIERYKARLVAKGFQQRDGIEYTETFNPVIKPATIRILFSLALHYSWPLKQLDVSNAFLHSHLTEEVFMEQPTDFKNNYPNYVCKLQKSFYGLKQTPRAWF